MSEKLKPEEKGYPKKVDIECPCCGSIENAVEHFYEGDPFPTYLHTCSDCGWEIGEDEWDEVDESSLP